MKGDIKAKRREIYAIADVPAFYISLTIFFLFSKSKVQLDKKREGSIWILTQMAKRRMLSRRPSQDAAIPLRKSFPRVLLRITNNEKLSKNPGRQIPHHAARGRGLIGFCLTNRFR